MSTSTSRTDSNCIRFDWAAKYILRDKADFTILGASGGHHVPKRRLGAARRDGRIEGRIEGREEGRKEGREEGREEGEANAKSEIAHKMLKAGLDPSLIKEVTGLEVN